MNSRNTQTCLTATHSPAICVGKAVGSLFFPSLSRHCIASSGLRPFCPQEMQVWLWQRLLPSCSRAVQGDHPYMTHARPLGQRSNGCALLLHAHEGVVRHLSLSLLSSRSLVAPGPSRPTTPGQVMKWVSLCYHRLLGVVGGGHLSVIPSVMYQ